MKRLLCLAIVSVSMVFPSTVLATVTKGDVVVAGFSKTIAGSVVQADDVLSGINEAMVVRANNAEGVIEWSSGVVPEKLSSYITFVAPAGFAYSGQFQMTMSLNGKEIASFKNLRSPEWKQKGLSGVELSFSKIKQNRSNDYQGFLYIRVPKSMVKAGVQSIFKITAEDIKSDNWFMVYTHELTTKTRINSDVPALIKDPKDGQLKGVVDINIRYIGAGENADILLNGIKVKSLPLVMGDNNYKLLVPQGGAKVEVKGSGISEVATVDSKDVKRWTINFVQHSHTDIGYTRPQTEILAEHMRYIDYALDYCDATDSYDDNAKFRWTCEAAWAVDEYLKCRPKEQIERLKKRVTERRIEIAGMYFNFDELPDEQTLASSLAPIKRFRENGIDVKMAMQNDVNGIGWCFSEFFPDLGIKYLNMGTHGHRALICFDKPTMFWWESPSGKKVLTFRAEHYMTGNFFGIESDNFIEFENKIFEYLNGLDAKNYPFDIISIQHSGYFTDNSPPSKNSCEMIRRWNAKYEYPKLRSAGATEFFEDIESRYADKIETIRGAWPDWWTDGFASGAREVATSRITHTEIMANQIALSLTKVLGATMPVGINSRIDEANKALAFYDEHTFGYCESVRDPYGKQSMEQRSLKESYAWEALRRSRMVGEEMMGLFQSFIPKIKTPSVAIINTLNWSHSGLAIAYIDHEILPTTSAFKFVDQKGVATFAQPIYSMSDGTYWGIWAQDVPAMGYKQYSIILENQPRSGGVTENKLSSSVVENKWYKVGFDENRATVNSLFDKELGKELLAKNGHEMGEFIYELLEERHSMEQYTFGKYERKSIEKARFKSYVAGDVWDSYKFVGTSEAGVGEDNFEIEVRIYNVCKRIDIACSIVKKDVRDPESIYIAFPFDLKDGKIYFDVQGGTIEAGVDQIPGSSNDWNTVQNFAAVRNDEEQLVIVTHETPLMQFGAINSGRYKAGATPQSTKIYSWPMNNYWVTNFNADQRGLFDWKYFITSSKDNSSQFATRFGWESRIPLLTRVLPSGESSIKGIEGSILDLGAENLLLVNMKPVEGENSVIMQLREIAGAEAQMNISSKVTDKRFTMQECDAVGDIKNGGSVRFNPWENKFVKISW